MSWAGKNYNLGASYCNETEQPQPLPPPPPKQECMVEKQMPKFTLWVLKRTALVLGVVL